MPDVIKKHTIKFSNPYALSTLISELEDKKHINEVQFKIENSSIELSEIQWMEEITSALSQIPEHITSVDFQDCNLAQLTDIPTVLNAIPKHVTRINLSNNNLGSYCENNEKTQALLQSLSRFKGVQLAMNHFDKMPANVSFKWPEEKQTTFIDLSENNFAAIGNRLEAFLEGIGLVQILWLAKNNFTTLTHAENLSAALAKTRFRENSRLNLGMNTFAENKLDAFKIIFNRLNANITELELYRVELFKLKYNELCHFFKSLPKTIKSLSIFANLLDAQQLTAEAGLAAEEDKDGFQMAIANISTNVNRVNMAGNNLLPQNNAVAMKKYLTGLPPSITEGSFDQNNPDLQFSALKTLQKKYEDVANAYIKYTTDNCFWSIVRWHGETGRNNARKMITLIKGAKTVNEVHQLINKNLDGTLHSGRKNAHSLRTMFLAARLDIPLIKEELEDLRDKFDEKKEESKRAFSF